MPIRHTMSIHGYSISDVFIRTIRTRSDTGKPPMLKISQISMRIYPRRNNCISLEDGSVPSIASRIGCTDLLPTAAFFLCVLHRRNRVVKMAMPQKIMTPTVDQSTTPARTSNATRTEISQTPISTEGYTGQYARSGFESVSVWLPSVY